MSLGNFCIITVSFTAAFWQRFGGRRKVFLVAAIVLMLFACDGRQSAMASVLIVAMLAVARVLPANVALLFLPLAVAAAVGVTALLGLRSGQDDLPGRIAVMVELLADMQLADWLGASDRLRIIAVDSGIVYLLITQSVLCVAILWGLVVTGMEERTRTHQTYKNGMFLYIAISMIVSYGFISIKTAAPMWFIYGMLAASGWARQVAADDRRPAALGLGRPTAGE